MLLFSGSLCTPTKKKLITQGLFRLSALSNTYNAFLCRSARDAARLPAVPVNSRLNLRTKTEADLHQVDYCFYRLFTEYRNIGYIST